MGKTKIFIVIMIVLINYNISAFDAVGKLIFGNFGISYIYNSIGNKGTSAYDIDLFKFYFYDRDSRLGLDVIPVSINLLNKWEDINYASFFNFDIHYCPLIIGKILYTNLYFTGGPSGIKYTANSNSYGNNNLWFDIPLFNASLGARLRAINFDKWDSPNLDIYCEYNVMKEDFKIGFYTRFLSPFLFLSSNGRRANEFKQNQ